MTSNALERQARLPLGEQAIPFALVTRPLAALYGMLTTLWCMAYDREWLQAKRLPGRVISVGNLAVGGTGKSPVVMMIAAELARQGHRPAILTRGYGSGIEKGDDLALKNGVVVMPSRKASRLPDEASMQSVALRDVPVVVGPARYEAARRYLALFPEEQPTHWILDDGFQHRRIARDVDIVLLDAERPWGNGALLPAGTLREPTRRLARAQVVMFSRASATAPRGDDLARVRAVSPGAEILRAVFQTELPRAPVSGGDPFDPHRHAPVLLACGIAKPAALRRGVEAAGVRIGDVLAVADHALFARDELVRRSERVAAVVTTAKDYWRDPRAFADLPKPVFVAELTVALDVDERARLFGRLAR